MIKENTIILTGAGASYEYGLPLGSQLVADIINVLANPDHFVVPGIESSTLIDLRTRLSDSNTPSIDLFLENNDDLSKAGKYMIAYCIMQRESAAYSNQFYTIPNWLNFIWQQMIDNVKSPEDFIANQIKFITFNYDRTIEFFLLRSISGFFNLKYVDAVDLLSSISIIHLYGDLGNYNSLNPKDKNYVQYESREMLRENEMLRKVLHWSSGIATINSRKERQSFTTAFEQLSNVSRLFVLGFGYDDTNVERLNLPDIARRCIVNSTCINMREGKKVALSKKFPHAKLNLSPWDIMTLLNNEF